MLDVAEGEPWTDGGWTKIGSCGKRLEIQYTNKGATHVRPVSNNGHDETIEGDRIKVINAMKTNHCVTEHLCVCHRKQQKGNQRLSWEIEHID